MFDLCYLNIFWIKPTYFEMTMQSKDSNKSKQVDSAIFVHFFIKTSLLSITNNEFFLEKVFETMRSKSSFLLAVV